MALTDGAEASRNRYGYDPSGKTISSGAFLLDFQ